MGCPKNILESATYRQVLESSGYKGTQTPEEADLLIYNTCGCLETLQEKAKSAIHKGSLIRGEQKDVQIIAAGCYPLIDKGNNLKEMNIDFFPPGDTAALKGLLNSTDKSPTVPSTTLFKEDLDKQPSFVNQPNHLFSKLTKIENKLGLSFPRLHNFFKAIMMGPHFHYVSVGQGCLGNCTFCGIKLAIGNPKSRPLHEIINNIRRGFLNGKKDIWLVSDDVGSWGHDFNQASAQLIREILLIPSELTYTINYFEPEMFLNQKEELTTLFTDPRIIQICLPIQTGSQKLLRRMGRHYDIAETIRHVKKLRKGNPQLIIKTQYIICFPGETWKDFLLTLLSMRHFDGIGVNTYARLKYTPAYKLKALPKHTIKSRELITKVVVGFYHLRFVLKGLFRFKKQRQKA